MSDTPLPTSSVASRTPSSSVAPVVNGPSLIKDYGAEQYVWVASHAMDYRFSQGLSWDPTPGLGAVDEHAARFYRLHSEGGRVIRFSMRFPHGSTQSSATRDAMTTLPGDSKVVWQRGFGSCYVVEFRSARLAAAFRAPEIRDAGGYVRFVFDSREADGGPPSYDANDVNGATAMNVTESKASAFPGC
jgi:hypothetical protein